MHSASQASEREAPWLLTTLPFFTEQTGCPAGSSIPEASQPQVSVLCIPGPSVAPRLPPSLPPGLQGVPNSGLYPHYIVDDICIILSPSLRICHGSSSAVASSPAFRMLQLLPKQPLGLSTEMFLPGPQWALPLPKAGP